MSQLPLDLDDGRARASAGQHSADLQRLIGWQSSLRLGQLFGNGEFAEQAEKEREPLLQTLYGHIADGVPCAGAAPRLTVLDHFLGSNDWDTGEFGPRMRELLDAYVHAGYIHPNGTDAEVQTARETGNSFTPIARAMVLGNISLALALLDHGADPTLCDNQLASADDGDTTRPKDVVEFALKFHRTNGPENAARLRAKLIELGIAKAVAAQPSTGTVIALPARRAPRRAL